MGKINLNLDSLKPKRDWRRHKVNEGTNTFRFLPPIGDMSNGYPYRKWIVCWGMADPESGRQRPYASPLTTSEKSCPVSEYVQAVQKKAEILKAQYQAKGLPEQDIKELLKSINNVIRQFKPRTVYVWNAIDKAGTVGLLELKPTAHKELKRLMSEYIRDYDQDPTSVNSSTDDSGVWFDIQRHGVGFDTEYKAVKVQVMTRINGNPTYVDDRAPLPQNVVENWSTLGYDLSTIYQAQTYDQLKNVLLFNMANIVADCPDAIIEGFEPLSIKTPAPKPVQQSAPAVSKPQSKVGIKLDAAGDDEDDFPDGHPTVSPTLPIRSVVQPTATMTAQPTIAAKVATTSNSSQDAIFEMANNIINGK